MHCIGSYDIQIPTITTNLDTLQRTVDNPKRRRNYRDILNVAKKNMLL